MIIGLVIGLVAGMIDQTKVKGGIIGTVLTGMIGAVIGGFLTESLVGHPVSALTTQSILISLAGALLLVLIQRMAFRDTGQIKTATKEGHE